jgi:hypothetical protein
MDDDDAEPTTLPDEEWLPIRAAARRLGVTPTAIRKRIERGTLETKPAGNHGRLVRIPVTVTVTGDRLAGEPSPGTLTVTGDRPEREAVTVTGDPAVMVTVTALLARIADLEARTADRDTLAAQIEALRAVLDLERLRGEEWKAERDEALRIALARRSWLPWRRSG